MRKSNGMLLGSIVLVGVALVIAVLWSRRPPLQPIVLTNAPAPAGQTKSHAPVVLDQVPARASAPVEPIVTREPAAKQSTTASEPEPSTIDGAERAALEAKLTRFLKNQEAARAPR